MPQIACYLRVSTDDQSLERQHSATAEYAQRELDADLGDLTFYRDKATGTNVNRGGYRELIEAVESYDAVVVNSVSRISRSIRDLDRTVERIVEDAGTELHIISEGFRLAPDVDDPYQKAMLQMLGVFAELEAEMAQQRTREGLAQRRRDPEYAHRPAPLGFEKDDGALVEGDDYHDVCAVLDMVASGDLSKRKAATRLDTTRATIRNALTDRPELYGLARSGDSTRSGNDGETAEVRE